MPTPVVERKEAERIKRAGVMWPALGFRRLGSVSVWSLLLLVLLALPAHAQRAAEAHEANLHTIRAILQSSDQDIDLAKAKLTIDRMIDPAIDVRRTLAQLDVMADAIRARLPRKPFSREIVEALRVYLYEPGPWNESRPYRYDFDDPFGRTIRNKLLPVYLETRKGNCVSMPLLFIILGQKLGLDVTAATVPAHVLVKYRDEQGRLHGFEATSGGAEER